MGDFAGLDTQPRWVCDTSSLFDYGWARYLRRFVSFLPWIRQECPEVLDVDQYVAPWDRPFIVLPPCWDEMELGLQLLKDSNHEWAEKMESTMGMLEQCWSNVGMLLEC